MNKIAIVAALLLGAAGEVRPNVKLRVDPNDPQQGDRIQIQSLMLNDNEEPMSVQAIYLRILDEKGIEIYPSSVMARQRAGFAVVISTREFPPGAYTVQVSNHDNFSPSASAPLNVRAPPFQLPPIVIPPLNILKGLQDVFKNKSAEPLAPVPVDKSLKTPVGGAPVLPTIVDFQSGKPGPTLNGEPLKAGVTPLDQNFQPVETPVEDTQNTLIRFHTQEDSRVCPICEPHDGETYDANDPDAPDIPLHKNCRCFYDIVEPGAEA